MNNSSIKFPTFDELWSVVKETISHIYSDERFLIDNGANEWAIAAQFYYWARHLWPKEYQKGLNFDSEYNLMSSIGNKELAKKEICVNGQTLRVRPDFLIHCRDKNELNFLWVEMKKRGGEDWKDDLNRLVGVTRETYEAELSCVMGYAYGLGVLFHKRNVRCMWYEQGHLLKNFYGRISKQGHWTWKECTANDSGVGND